MKVHYRVMNFLKKYLEFDAIINIIYGLLFNLCENLDE